MYDREKLAIIYKNYNKSFQTECIVNSPRDGKQTFLKNILYNKLLIRSESKFYATQKNVDENPFDILRRTDDVVWFTIGFQYNAMGFNFGYIFDLDETLKNFEVYKIHINSYTMKIIMRFWRDNDDEYLQKVLNYNKDLSEAINHFLSKDKGTGNGSTSKFWFKSTKFKGEDIEYEKLLFYFYINYTNKKLLKELNKQIKEQIAGNRVLKNAHKYLKEEYIKSDISSVEMFSRKSIILDNSSLLGFFINEKLSNDEVNLIKKFINNSDKIDKEKFIIFDGISKVLFNNWKV